MIDDLRAVVGVIQQIQKRCEQVKNNKGYASSLKNRVTILINVLKQMEQFPITTVRHDLLGNINQSLE